MSTVILERQQEQDSTMQFSKDTSSVSITHAVMDAVMECSDTVVMIFDVQKILKKKNIMVDYRQIIRVLEKGVSKGIFIKTIAGYKKRYIRGLQRLI